MKKKKLIRSATLPSTISGLLKDQLKFMSKEYEVIVLTSGGEQYDKLLKDQGVRGYKIPFTRKITPFSDLVAFFMLVWIFIKERPDIVHSHTTKDGFLCMIAAWLTRVPHRLYTIAGLAEFSRKNQSFVDLIEKITFDCATLLLPNSEKMKEIYIQKGLLKRNKAHVVGNGSSNGIDTSYFSRNAVGAVVPDLRGEYNIKTDDYVYLFIGRVVGDKGVNELVEAFCSLYNQIDNKNVKLLIVGGFERDLDAVAHITEKRIDTHSGIIYAGFQQDVRPFFSTSDCFVFPSYREGMPNVVMQAGAMELPCIVSDINGCNEIVEDGVNGYIIPKKETHPLEERMQYLYQHQEVGIQMGKKSREIIEKRYERAFFWEALLSEYNQLP